MTRSLLLAAIVLMVSGCYKESPLQSERAEVLQMTYVPSTSGLGTGMTTGGNLTVTSVSTDEVWAIVVRCYDHNKTFSLRGKDLYQKCRVGQIITLKYVEYTNSKGEVMDYKTKSVEP